MLGCPVGALFEEFLTQVGTRCRSVGYRIHTAEIVVVVLVQAVVTAMSSRKSQYRYGSFTYVQFKKPAF